MCMKLLFCRQALPSVVLAVRQCQEITRWDVVHLTIMFSCSRYFVPNPSLAAEKAKAKQASKEGKAPAAEAADVPKELELLKGITGYAQPGVLMALMGGSGAAGPVHGLEAPHLQLPCVLLLLPVYSCGWGHGAMAKNIMRCRRLVIQCSQPSIVCLVYIWLRW